MIQPFFLRNKTPASMPACLPHAPASCRCLQNTHVINLSVAWGLNHPSFHFAGCSCRTHRSFSLTGGTLILILSRTGSSWVTKFSQMASCLDGCSRWIVHWDCLCTKIHSYVPAVPKPSTRKPHQGVILFLSLLNFQFS